MKLTGACLCGSIRYEISPRAGDVADYCHCEQCRRASGAPVVAWVQVSPARFRVTLGTAKAFASSAHSTRWFCPDCGGQLYMSYAGNHSIGVTLGTLDTPDALRPTVHGWEGERIPWFETTDTLPRYPQAPPYDE
jgi:hypothetical protein